MKRYIPAPQRIVTRLGWYEYYADLFNRTGRETAATLALWHYLLHMEFGD